MVEMEAVEVESNMDQGFVLSDNILGNEINDSKFDHLYSYKPTKSLNDLVKLSYISL